MGFPGVRVGNSPFTIAEDRREAGSIPESGRSLGVGWQPSPVFLPGKSKGQRNLVGYSPWGHRFIHDWSYTHTHTHTYTHKPSCTKLTWVAHLKLFAKVKAKNPFSSVQSLSNVWLFMTPWTTVRQISLSITNSQSLLKLMSIRSLMPSNHLIFCRPLVLLPLIFHSVRVFSNESVLRIRWPKYWSFSFSISSSNQYSGLISFRMDRLDFLEV